MKVGKEFLPVSVEDLKNKNIKELDFIIVTGDAYVDHPSFGTAIISRVLESEGYKVGIIPQPDWKDINSFKVLGKPRLGFLVNSGNIDSMVNHYTSLKRRRNSDLYSPGGEGFKRPDRAVIVYCNKVREAYKNVPIIIGGIEASLRRFAHYDYWDDAVRRSIILDSAADLLIYGMGEKTVVQIANLLNYGMDIKKITDVLGTVTVQKNLDNINDYIEVPSYDEVSKDKMAYAKAYKIQHEEQDPIRGKTLVQKHMDGYVIQNPPQMPLTVEEMDMVYNLPYTRTYHPMYNELGGIPAINEVKFSITSHRGCFGGCSFCALNFHQGRIIQNRSQNSIIEEASLLTTLKDFKGYIHDVGGPTANFRHKACKIQEKVGTCKNRQCLFPSPCKNLIIDHREYLELLRKVRAIKGVKKVFIRSGIRYDYLVYDKNQEFFKELCKYHISGQLKVAPEHVSARVLKLMGKPNHEVYMKFVSKYNEINKALNQKQYLVPYMISSHPGSDLKAAIELAEHIKKLGYMPEQVQDFYPTPGSLSTCMYYTGINPLTMEKVYVPKDYKEKEMQRALMQFQNPKNYDLVHEALIKAHKEMLIGNGNNCLIPQKPSQHKNIEKNKSKGNIIKNKFQGKKNKTNHSTK